jgi:uncharacterized membrane protein (UPF0136 family)
VADSLAAAQGRRYIPGTMKSLSNWMIGYGVFLAAVGVIGFLSNPEKAATALLSGGTFGALSILWGALLRRGLGWARWAARTMTAFLTAVFTWRATVSWLAVQDGQSEKLVAAGLITAMLAASTLTLFVLFARRAPSRLSAHASSR